MNNPAYRYLPAGHTPLLATERPATSVDPLTYVTLKHAGILSVGEDHYRVLKRAGDGSWSAARLERDRLSANFQGNPLWPQQTLADYPHLSAHFALSASSTGTACILPLTATINRRLDELFGEEESPRFGFTEAGLLTERAYVDQFINEGKLPLAEVFDRDSIHDWSYHFVTFLFRDYLENVRLNLKYIRDHIGRFSGRTSYAWNYYGHTLDEQARMKGQAVTEDMDHAEAVYRQMAISLDVATAKIVQLFGMHRKGLIGKCRGEMDLIRAFSGGVTMAALKSILWMEEDLELALPMPEAGRGRLIKAEPMDYLLQTLQRLEQRAASLTNLFTSRRREEIFREVLSGSF